MIVDIDECGTVTAGGRPVDYATAYEWCLDSPETVTELVLDTKAFALVIAAAEHCGPEDQAAAVRKAFAAGVPRRPGPGWADAHGSGGAGPGGAEPADLDERSGAS